MAMWCHQHMLGDYKGRYRAGLWIKNDEKKKITINCFTPAAWWKKKIKEVQTKEGDFFLPPPPNQSSKNASSTAPFFPDLVTQLEKICGVCERRCCLLYQLLGKRLQKQPCNYPGVFLSLPPKSEASSLSSCQGQSLWWYQQESDLDKFLDLEIFCLASFLVVLTHVFYSSCPLGVKKNEREAEPLVWSPWLRLQGSVAGGALGRWVLI